MFDRKGEARLELSVADLYSSKQTENKKQLARINRMHLFVLDSQLEQL
jgi:hypothetical protein